MPRTVKAIYINPKFNTVVQTNLEVKEDNDFELEQCYKLIGCDLVEFVYTRNREILVVDEEGLLKDLDNQSFFKIEGIGQEVFAGSGIIIKIDNTEYEIPIDYDIEDFKSQYTVEFPTALEILKERRTRTTW